MSWTAPPPPPPGIQQNTGSSTSTYMYPAYTTVKARQGFGQAPPQTPYYGSTNPSQPTHAMATAPAPSAPQQKVDWPDSVRSYVQRSFQDSNNDPSVPRPDMETKLKETIRYYQESGLMYQVDWDRLPLPQEMIKTERQEAIRSLMTVVPSPAQTSSAFANTPSAKKRKSDHEHPSASPAPWRATKTLSLEDRITNAPGDKRSMDGPLGAKSKFQKNAEKRQRRGDGGYQSSYRSPSPPPTAGPIVGCNTELEKRYFRLTAPPKAEAVRPEHILHQTLDLLKKKWRREQNYNYICEQFKSLRQDLTVQRIRNEFTVNVYEIHARIALEKGDLGEYNQCQTQLRALYASGLKGNAIEFKAYRILYFIYTANRASLNDAIADLTTAEKEELPIRHALQVRSALALGNHHRFFQLYLDVPNMGAYLMDMFVKRERLAALANMCKAFKPDLKLRYVTEELAFESDAEAAQFIIDTNGQHLLEERQESIAFLTGKAGQVFEDARSDAFRRVDLKGQI